MKRLFLKKTLAIVLIVTLVSLNVTLPVGAVIDEGGLLREATDYQDRVEHKTLLFAKGYLRRSGQQMTEIYQSMWQSNMMDNKLDRSISQAVQDVQQQTDLFNKIRFLWNEEVQDEITNNIFQKCLSHFGPVYEQFMDDFLDIYSKTILRDMNRFASELKWVRAEEASFLPGYRVLTTLSIEPALARIQAATDVPKIESPIGLNNFKGTTTVITVCALKRMLRQRITQEVTKKGIRAAGAKVFNLLEGPGGWILAIGLFTWDAYDIGTDIVSVPEKIKDTFYQNLSNSYHVQAPEIFWKKIRPDVEKEFDKVMVVTGSFDQIVQQLAACQAYREVSASLSDGEQDLLCKKLLLLHQQTGRDLCLLSQEVGSVLPKVSAGQISCVAKAYDIMDTNHVAQWLALTGNGFCQLMELPEQLWARYQPETKNLVLLRWIYGLPRNLQKTVAALQKDTALWIYSNIDDTQKVILLNGRSSMEVESEVVRLSGIPSEDRAINIQSTKQKDAISIIKKAIPQEIRDFIPDSGQLAMIIRIMVAIMIILVLIPSIVMICRLFRRLIKLNIWILFSTKKKRSPEPAN